MKKEVCIILLLCISIVYGIEYTSIYSGTVKDGEIVKADQKEFQFYIVMTDSFNRTKMHFPNGRTSLIQVNDSVLEYPYKVSLQRIFLGGDDEFNIATQQYSRYADIIIEKLEEEISIDRTFTKTTFLEGEKVMVKVTLKNDGSAHIFDAEYVDEYPSSFKITDIKDCLKIGNKVFWQGSLYFNKQVECEYTIMSNNETALSQVAYLHYDTINITNAQNLVIENSPLKILTNISSKEVSVGEEISILITLTNEDNSRDINEIEYRITLSEGLVKVSHTGALVASEKSYIYSEPLEKGQSENISLILRVEKSGKLELTEKAIYILDVGEEKTYSLKNSFEINGLLEDVIISIPYKHYREFDTVTIPISIKNPNGIAIKNIDIDITSNFGLEKQVLLERLLAYQDAEESTITGKINANPWIQIKTKYQTQFGEYVSVKKEFNLSILGQEEIVQEKNKESTVGGIPHIGVVGTENIEEEERISIDRLRQGIREIQKPIWIVIITGVLSLAFLIFWLIRRNKKQKLEDRIEGLE